MSVKDYFLAKQFDKDGDGKLNEKELAEAKKALNEGYADRFMFGLERHGSMPLATEVDIGELEIILVVSSFEIGWTLSQIRICLRELQYLYMTCDVIGRLC